MLVLGKFKKRRISSRGKHRVIRDKKTGRRRGWIPSFKVALWRYEQEEKKEKHLDQVFELAGDTQAEELDERAATGNRIRDEDDQYPVDYERRSTKQSKQPAKPKVKVGIREYRKGHWQLFFSHDGKQVHLQKWIDGTPLTARPMALALKRIIEKDGYDPVKFGKDKTYNFDVAARNWVKLSRISPEWKKERSRIVEKLLIPFFARTDIRHIPSIKVSEFQAQLQDGHADKYCKNVMGELKAFFRYYKEDIPRLPEFRLIKVQDKPIKWLTEDEQDKVLECIPPHHRPIFQFLIFYGSRLNEACGLRWDDVDLDHGVLAIQYVVGMDGQLKQSTKTKKIRLLPIIEETEHLFREPSEGFVFNRKGKPYTSKALGRIWSRANKKSGIKKINVYNATRHSWASQRAGVKDMDMPLIQAVLGHTNAAMTKRYADIAVDKLRQVIKGRRVHKVFIPSKEVKLLEDKGNMVGGTGIEPVTSGL